MLFHPGMNRRVRHLPVSPGLSLLLLVLLLAAAVPAGAQTAVGVTVGLNNAKLNGDIPDRLSYRNRSGPVIGGIIEFKLGDDVNLSLQPMYVQKGSDVGFKPRGAEIYQDSLEVKLDYVALPILAKVFIGGGRAFVTGGFDLAYLLDGSLKSASGELEAKTRFATFDLTADFGIGFTLPVKSAHLTFELRYQQSLVNLAKNGGQEGDDAFPERFRSLGIQLLAGWLLPLGGD